MFTKKTKTASALVVLTLVSVSIPAQAIVPDSGKDYTTFGGVWNSCETIGYRVNLNGARKELPRIKKAFNNISAVSSLRFQYEGTTDVIPFKKSPSDHRYDERTDITLALSRGGYGPRKSELWLKDGSIGYGGPEMEDGENTRGAAAFDLSAVNTLSKTLRTTLYMHELGHVIGLGHAKGTRQIMSTPLHEGAKPVWGKGDLAGLKKLGYGYRPCQPSGPLEVTQTKTYANDNRELILSWNHDPSSMTDIAGGSRVATTEYEIVLERIPRKYVTWIGDGVWQVDGSYEG